MSLKPSRRDNQDFNWILESAGITMQTLALSCDDVVIFKKRRPIAAVLVSRNQIELFTGFAKRISG